MSSQLSIGAATRAVIDADGHQLAALRAGDHEAPPVLLVPGYTGSKEDFGPILRSLAEAGLFATAIDLPGQYESAPLERPEQYHSAALAPIVTAAARAIGGPVHLLGHSFGGLVARAAVIDEPSAFMSLVLMASGPAALPGPRRVMIDRLEPALASGGMPLVYSMLLAATAAQPGFVPPPPVLAEFLQRRFLASDAVMMQGMGEAVRIEPDRVAELAAALAVGRLPALVLYGTHDDAWPPAVQAAMARDISARVAEIPDAVHSPAVENPPATVTALIDFWLS